MARQSTPAELLAAKQEAIANKLARTGESAGEYTARTGIDPTALMENGEVVYSAPFNKGAGNLSALGMSLTAPLTNQWGTDKSAVPPDVLAGGSGQGVATSMGAVGAIGGLADMLGLGSLGGILGTVGAAGAGIYGLLQALGLGEGGGLFGNNLLGGDTSYLGGVPLGGPGLAEPPSQYVLKEWHVNYDWGTLQYYLVKMPGQSRKIFLYNTRTKSWKWWTFRTPRLAVIGKNMPSHKNLVRLRTNLKKHATDARTLLKLTSPTSLRTPRRRRRR